MEKLSSPHALHYYNTLHSQQKFLDLFVPHLTHPTLHIANNSSLFNGISSELLKTGYSGWSISSFDTPEKNLITFIALFAFFQTGSQKLKNRSIPFWETLVVTNLPINASYFLPALIVKQAFYLKTGRSSVDHTKRAERVAYIVMTTAFSVFVFPKLFAKLRGNLTPISNHGLAKYFVIQSLWHLAVNESMALVGEKMREDIRANPKKWLDYVLDPDYNMRDPGYGLMRTLVASLKTEHLPTNATVPLALIYLYMKPHFEGEDKKQEADTGAGIGTEIKDPEAGNETSRMFKTLQTLVERKYPFLFWNTEKVKTLQEDDIQIHEGEEILWVHFLKKHQKDLPPEVYQCIDLATLRYRLFGGS